MDANGQVVEDERCRTSGSTAPGSLPSYGGGYHWYQGGSSYRGGGFVGGTRSSWSGGGAGTISRGGFGSHGGFSGGE